MSTTIKHVRMAPKGAKPTNPKYTLTLTRGEIAAIRLALWERYAEDVVMQSDNTTQDAVNVIKKIGAVVDT